MFEIEHIKIFKKYKSGFNSKHEKVWISDYILQIGDSLLPCNCPYKVTDDYLKEFDLLLSTSSLSVLISWLTKFLAQEDKTFAEENLCEFLFHYFYSLFQNFFKDVIDKMKLDIEELEKL